MIPITLALRLAYPDADDKTLFEEVAEWHEGECRSVEIGTKMLEGQGVRELNVEIARLKEENASLAEALRVAP